MHKGFIATAALLGAVAVGLGAFAAHGLKQIFSADLLQIFETAVRYQFYHVFALLATGILYASYPSKWLSWSGRLFIAGIILFSGSLYLLCCFKHAGMDMNWLGAVTPLGGICFIGGWLFMVLPVLKRAKNY